MQNGAAAARESCRVESSSKPYLGLVVLATSAPGQCAGELPTTTLLAAVDVRVGLQQGHCLTLFTLFAGLFGMA